MPTELVKILRNDEVLVKSGEKPSEGKKGLFWEIF